MSNRLAEQLRAILTLDPNAPAIEFAGEWTTWASLHAIAAGVDQRLAAAGLSSAAPIGLVLRNHPAMVGSVDRRPAVRGDGGHRERIARRHGSQRGHRRPPIGGRHRARNRLAASRSARGRGRRIGAECLERPRCGDGAHRFGGAGPRPVPQEPDGIAVEMLTSGTTGPPKRIPLTYEAFGTTVAAAGAHYSGAANGGPRLRSGVAIVSSPLVHMSGLFRTLLNLCEGRRIALLERFRVPDFVELVCRQRPRAASLVPSALAMVLDADVPADVFADVEVVTSGTAHLPVAVQEAFEKRYDVAVLTSYGATEFAGGVAGWNLELHRRWAVSKRGSVGRPQRGREVRISSMDDGGELSAGDKGRIEVRTDGGQWVRTTDLGRLDSDGFLYVDGRTDDVIVRGGFKVSPATSSPRCAATPMCATPESPGCPTAGWAPSPSPLSSCVRSNGRIERITGFSRERLTRYQVPARLIIVTELPRTPSMKVSQPALREMFDEAEELRA